MTPADGLPHDFHLQQSAARYSLDGMQTYGLLERSCTGDDLEEMDA